MRDFRTRPAVGDGGASEQGKESERESFGFTLGEIQSVVEMLRGSDVSEFKLERGEDKIWLKRGGEQAVVHQPMPVGYAAAPQPVASPITAAQPATGAVVELTSPAPSAPEVKPTSQLITVTSPMVGTFYRRPAPDADPFVSVGDIVKKGDVICIVEAMKLMNEIESEVNGRIAEVCLKDGQMVEYGEVLFRVEPS